SGAEMAPAPRGTFIRRRDEGKGVSIRPQRAAGQNDAIDRHLENLNTARLNEMDLAAKRPPAELLKLRIPVPEGVGQFIEIAGLEQKLEPGRCGSRLGRPGRQLSCL